MRCVFCVLFYCEAQITLCEWYFRFFIVVVKYYVRKECRTSSSPLAVSGGPVCPNIKEGGGGKGRRYRVAEAHCQAAVLGSAAEQAVRSHAPHPQEYALLHDAPRHSSQRGPSGSSYSVAHSADYSKHILRSLDHSCHLTLLVCFCFGLE